MTARISSTHIELTIVIRDEDTKGINEESARMLADTQVKEFYPDDSWTYDDTERISYKMLAFHYRM